MRWTAAVLVVSLLWTVPAPAQPSPAEQRFAEGEALYAPRKFEDAAAKYREAYLLSKVPALLFNVAQAYRLAGRCPEAVAAYDEYLREAPDAPNRADAEARRNELAPTCPPAKPPPPRKPRVVNPPIVVDQKPPPKKGGKALLWTGVGVGAAGLVCGGLATYFAIRSNKYSNDLTERFDMGGVWDEEADRLERRGENLEKKATIFGIGAGVLVIAGGALTYFGVRAGSQERVSVAPTPGGAMVGVSGSF